MSEMSMSCVYAWSEGNSKLIRNLTIGLKNPMGIFVTRNGDIYVDADPKKGYVTKLRKEATIGVKVMKVISSCYDLFVDVNGNIYCSMGDVNRVVRKAFGSGSSASSSKTVAGTGTAGSSSMMLNSPRGIFVDVASTLYVADCGNNRVQRFLKGQLNGTTVAGHGAPTTNMLNCPNDVVLDADGHLFIVDSLNHRVVRSGPNGFRCVAGCAGVSGSTSDKLNNPRSLSFDSHGNLFVTDTDNSRVQQFHLVTGSCGESQTQSSLMPLVPFKSARLERARRTECSQKEKRRSQVKYWSFPFDSIHLSRTIVFVNSEKQSSIIPLCAKSETWKEQ